LVTYRFGLRRATSARSFFDALPRIDLRQRIDRDRERFEERTPIDELERLDRAPALDGETAERVDARDGVEINAVAGLERETLDSTIVKAWSLPVAATRKGKPEAPKVNER